MSFPSFLQTFGDQIKSASSHKEVLGVVNALAASTISHAVGAPEVSTEETLQDAESLAMSIMNMVNAAKFPNEAQ